MRMKATFIVMLSSCESCLLQFLGYTALSQRRVWPLTSRHCFIAQFSFRASEHPTCTHGFVTRTHVLLNWGCFHGSISNLGNYLGTNSSYLVCAQIPQNSHELFTTQATKHGVWVRPSRSSTKVDKEGVLVALQACKASLQPVFVRTAECALP